MCQYTARCRVRRHRPGTVCPHTGIRTGWRSGQPILRDDLALLAPNKPSKEGASLEDHPGIDHAVEEVSPSSAGRRYSPGRLSQVDGDQGSTEQELGVEAGPATTGPTSPHGLQIWITGLGFLGMIILLVSFTERHTSQVLTLGLVVVSSVVAIVLSRDCTAWNATSNSRCAKTRRGFLQRCELENHSHSVQCITQPELAAAVCVGVAVLGVLTLLS